MNRESLRTVRVLLVLFMLALAASGLSVIPLQWELGILNRWLGSGSSVQGMWPSLADWISRVNEGVQQGYGRYPFLALGTDWLAFGHVAIALAFMGAVRDPLKNVWVVEFGMLVCALVIPWALIFGWLRGIPPFWRAVDMSFGIFGFIPLWWVRRMILRSSQGTTRTT